MPLVTWDGVDSVRWQAISDMGFRMPDGYLFTPAPPPRISWDPTPPSVTTNTLIAVRYGSKPPLDDPDVRREIRAQLAAWHVQAVVVGPMVNQDAVLSGLTWVLDRPPEPLEGVYVWWNVDSG